jgi:hypothetical protein
MHGVFFLSALTLALAYTYAQENPNRQLSYFIVTFSAKYLPYSMLAMTFVMASPQAALQQATGLIAAHLYEFLTKTWPEHGGGRKLINHRSALSVLHTVATPLKTWDSRDRLAQEADGPAGSAKDLGPLVVKDAVSEESNAIA